MVVEDMDVLNDKILMNNVEISIYNLYHFEDDQMCSFTHTKKKELKIFFNLFQFVRKHCNKKID